MFEKEEGKNMKTNTKKRRKDRRKKIKGRKKRERKKENDDEVHGKWLEKSRRNRLED